MLPVLSISLLIVALGSIVLYQKSSHELTRVLTAVTAAVCLIWGFAISHWLLHLLSLFLLFQFKSDWLDFLNSSGNRILSPSQEISNRE